MAFMDMVRRLTGKDDAEKSTAAIEAAMQDEGLHILRASDVDTQQYTKVPLLGVAALGAAFAQLPESARTVVNQVQLQIGVDQPLYIATNPKGLSGYVKDNGYGITSKVWHKNAQGKNVIAGDLRFQQIPGMTINQSNQSIMPINPMTMVVAAALVSIDRKLSELQKTAGEILQFLSEDKKARQRGNLNMLTEVLAEYKDNYHNEKLCALRSVAVQDIRKEAHQDILFYQERIENRLKKKQLLHASQQVQGLIRDVTGELQEYSLACYLYAFSTYLDVMLQKNFDTSAMEAVLQKMQEHAERYSQLYAACRRQLADYQRTAVEARMLGSLGSTVKAVGTKVAASALLSKGPVDEALISAGESLGRRNRDAVEKRLAVLAPLEDNKMSALIDNLRTVEALYNQSDRLLMDGEYLYIRNA